MTPIMQKPTPAEIDRLRAAFPEGAPRFMQREIDLVIERATSAEDQADGGIDDADESRTIPISISSESPVLRYDWWTDERYFEVLDHTASSIDLSYSRDGLPFVASHRAWDADSQHGIVENVRPSDKILRGDVRFSRAQRSQEIAQDMRDKIRNKVSVGYLVGDQYEQTKGAKDEYPTRRYKAWMPLEVSTVPVPADYDVGVGRAASMQSAMARFLELHPSTSRRTSPAAEANTRSTHMENPAAAAAASGTPDIRAIEREAGERAAQRVKNITDLAVGAEMRDKLDGWLREGTSEEAVLREINVELTKRMKNQASAGIAADGTVSPNAWRSNMIALNDRDHARFSFARALILADPSLERESGRGVDFGFEREMIQEARKRTPMTAKDGAGIIPFVTRANIDSATSTTGGPFKFTQPGDFIPLLRNATSVMRAGARVIPGLTGPVTFPKQTGPGTASWVAENPGSDMSRSNLVTSTVSLAFKTLQTATAVSRQALFSAASGNYDLEQIIREDLARVIALGLDLGALNGLGSSNQPLGVLQDTSVGTATALGTNGGTIAWTNVVDLETTVAVANGVGRMSYLTNAKQRARGRNLAVLGNTANGVPIWQGSPSYPDAGGGMIPTGDGTVNGYDAYCTNQVPSNLTKGTSTTICSAWVFGAFEQMLVGMFGGGFEVLVDPYTLKLQNMIDLTAWIFADVANRYPVAFATLKDAL
jgi:HK97 family phage major capsid protein